MKDKVLINLFVPEIDKSYDLFIPIGKKVGNIIVLLNKSVFELSDGVYYPKVRNNLYNKDTGLKYELNSTIKDTNIRNGTKLILL